MKNKLKVTSKAGEKDHNYSQGYEKLRSYFKEVIRTESFQKQIDSIRKKHNIPLDGFAFDNNYMPLGLPAKWHLENKNDFMATLSISRDIRKLCRRLDLYDSDPWMEILWDYIVYNDSVFIFNPSAYAYDLCLITDGMRPMKDFDPEDPEDKHLFSGLSFNTHIAFPVAIIISPYASKRDILDFVSKNFKGIELLQKKYQKKGIKIGKIKIKSKEKRDQFIYEHKGMPLKKIRKLVWQRFGETLDDGHVGKILSKETKKRKDM